MLNKIIKFSLDNRLLVIVVSVLILIGGGYIASRMEVDVFPDLNAPTVVVMTEAYGMAPEEVERLVTFPIETAVNGATNIRRVRSSSAMGFSLIWAEFDWGMNVYDARQIIAEKLNEISGQFPKGVETPVLAPQSSLLGEIMIFSISSSSINEMELRTIADWNIRPRLLSIGGVAQITVHGGELKEYQILADPAKLNFYNVSFNELVDVCDQSNDNAAGGSINQYANEYVLRGMIRSSNVDDLKNILIKDVNGSPVRVSDVAEVKIGGSPKIGEGSYNGERAVVLTVNKQPGINTIELTRQIESTLDEIGKKLPEGVNLNPAIFKQSDFIETSINNVQKALLEGAFFVVLILFVFLMNMRTTIISLLAIPISLIVSILSLKLLGITINTMSLGGMAIAIGSIVDDAIIDVENVYKRLKENRESVKEHKKNALPIIFKASKEIRASILNATLIIIVAFVPLFFLSGMEGRMLRPLGISFIVSLFASLVVAVTLTPVLCSYLLVNSTQLNKHEKGSRLSRAIMKWYSKSLENSIDRKGIFISGALVLFMLAVFMFTTFGRSFLPPFNEGSLTINLATLPGISLAESDKIGKQAEERLLSIPEISATSRKTGRAELAEHSFGSNVSEIEVPFNLKDRSRDEFIAEVREKLSGLSGVITSVGQPISHRIDHLLSGSKTNIAIKLFGTDLKKMHAYGTEIQNNIKDIEGLVDLSVEQQVDIPQIQIKPRREMLIKYGISMVDFGNFIENGFGGKNVGEVFEAEKSFNIILRLDDKYRTDINRFEDILINSGNNEMIPLGYVADIVSSSGPNTITRENVKRKIVISANVAERDIRSVVNEIQRTIDETVLFPDDYYIEYGGQFESEAKASKILFWTSLATILIIFLILFQEFKNAALAGIVLINLPLSLIGGVLAISITSYVISIPAIIGFITLFGIATRNGILLVSRYQQLTKQGKELREIIIHGSEDRLLPILMTALTAAFALIPLALAGDKPGNEIQSPMAIVLLGGLLTSTLLNLYIIPLVYYSLSKKKLLHAN